jgi:Bacterial Ig-like domain (group 3)
MRTQSPSRTLTRRRAAAALATFAIPLGMLATTTAPAEAYAAPGSPLESFIDTTGNSDPADAIQNGWWGHEGAPNDGTGTLTSFLDMDGTNTAALFAVFPAAELGNIRVAFVPTSAGLSGANEKPVATAGQTVDQVFGSNSWFMDAGFGTALSGNTNPNDSVGTISTPAEFNAWFAAGQPLQGYDNNLVLHDVSAPGNPVSTAPQGKSILNRWPANTDISMVFYLSTGVSTNGKPVVKVGGDGKAITAYMPFTTRAKPGDATRSSAGYTDNTFGVLPVGTTTTLAVAPASPQTVGTPITLTGTVAAAAGTATGTVEFFDGVTSLGSGPLNGSGVASLPGVLLAAGSHSLTAKYLGNAPFTTSTSSAVPFVINGPPAVTTTIAASAVPGADSSYPVALSGTVTAADSTCPAGKVEFKEGATVLETVLAPTSSPCVFAASHVFPVAGSHTVTAVFTPTGNYTVSTNSVTFSLAAPANVSSDPQDIKATVPAGTIIIDTPYTAASPLDLGNMALTADLGQYTASATFEGIHLLDTRAGALPWAVTALAGPLTSGGNSINGQNVGLTNLIQDPGFPQVPGLGIITPFNNPAASPAVAPAASGNLGLGGTPKTILSATQGPANVQYKGTLTLNAPTTTPTGTYQGTITFTAS